MMNSTSSTFQLPAEPQSVPVQRESMRNSHISLTREASQRKQVSMPRTRPSDEPVDVKQQLHQILSSKEYTMPNRSSKSNFKLAGDPPKGALSPIGPQSNVSGPQPVSLSNLSTKRRRHLSSKLSKRNLEERR